jgi:hypothetical protein
MKIILLISTIALLYSLRILPTKTTGTPIGIGLYNAGLVTQALKRPQDWFINIMSQKDNEDYFRRAEENGLRYQTQLLQDNLEQEYNDYNRNFEDEKMRGEIIRSNAYIQP